MKIIGPFYARAKNEEMGLVNRRNKMVNIRPFYTRVKNDDIFIVLGLKV